MTVHAYINVRRDLLVQASGTYCVRLASPIIETLGGIQSETNLKRTAKEQKRERGTGG